jgi:NTE family protein
MSLGARFEFTQDQFDLLCSDLSSYSIARAVAASSAFPILLSPITLKNYAGSCGFEEPQWVDNALADRDIAQRRYYSALNTRSYEDSQQRPFVHLMDGGVADNIGLRGPLLAVTSLDAPWSVLRMINLKRVRKVVVIVVNAKTDPDTTMDKNENAPGWKEVLMTVATDPLDNYSFETIDLLMENIKQWQRDDAAIESCNRKIKARCPQAVEDAAPPAKVDFYTVLLGFDLMNDPQDRSWFKNLPTTFNLPPETIDRLRAAAAKLLEASPSFQALLDDLK